MKRPDSNLKSKNKFPIKRREANRIMQFLKQPTEKIAETLTGILASEVKDWKLSAGRVIQAVIKGNLLTQLGREIEYYMKKGRIKEDYLESAINRASLKELLKFIDEEAPDEVRFRAMKSLFLFSVSKGISQKDEELAYELMAICRELASGEILILKAAYDIVKGRLAPGMSRVDLKITNRNQWLNLISKQIGHNIPALVERYENHLIELKLISRRTLSDGSGIAQTPYFRLTQLGYKLCEFMTKYG